MRHILYLAVLLFITGCSYSTSTPKALDEAQRMMQIDPSGALSRLNEVDVSQFRDSATMARWALLYIEALAVNNLSAPTDTIAGIAIDYYRRHNSMDELQKAMRLKALIQSSGNPDALASALYLQKEKEFYLYRERAKRDRYMLIGISLLLLAGGVIAWMRQRIKLQTLQNEMLITEASGLKALIHATRGDVSRLEAKLHGLLDRRFALIDSLCQTYYESQSTKTERKAIIDKVKNEIEAVRTDSLAEMEQAVNDCRDNLLLDAREKYPDLRPEEYQLMVYLASGLSTRTISLLLGESVDVVYKRKSRLKRRLKETVAPSRADIMDIF